MSKHGKSVISKQGKLQIVICSNLIIKKKPHFTSYGKGKGNVLNLRSVDN